jgi:hypothetical protein
LELTKLRARVGEGTIATQIDALNKKLQELTGTASRRPGTPPNLVVLARLQTLFNVIQDVDRAPTAQVAVAVTDIQRESNSLLERWRAIEAQDVPALNQQLQAASLPRVEVKER